MQPKNWVIGISRFNAGMVVSKAAYVSIVEMDPAHLSRQPSFLTPEARRQGPNSDRIVRSAHQCATNAPTEASIEASASSRDCSLRFRSIRVPTAAYQK